MTSSSLLEKIQLILNSTALCVTSFLIKQGVTQGIMWSPSIFQPCSTTNVISVKCPSTPRTTWQCTGLGSTNQIRRRKMRAMIKISFTYPNYCVTNINIEYMIKLRYLRSFILYPITKYYFPMILGIGFDRYGHTDILQTDTDTPFQNLYQTDTDTDIYFEIHIKPIPIIGIYLY